MRLLAFPQKIKRALGRQDGTYPGRTGQRGAWFCPVRHGTGAGCSRLSPGCRGTPAELDGPLPTTSPNGPWLPVERSAGRASSRRKLDETWAIILHVEATLWIFWTERGQPCPQVCWHFVGL